MEGKQLVDFIVEKLDDIKAQDIQVLDVHGQTTVTDYMIIASGTSSQHVRSIAAYLKQEIKQQKHPILSYEGDNDAEWVLIDLADAIVHIMLPQSREYYELDKLWAFDDQDQACASN